MRIDVSGHSFVFPDECACCGGSADAELGVSATKTTGKRVVHSKTNAWDIPYCGRCVGHVKSAQAARMRSLLLGFSSILVGAFLWYTVNPGIGVLGGSATILAASLAYSTWMVEARARCSSGCVCVGSAVAYLGWHGTLHRFDVKSASFARDFHDRKSTQTGQSVAAGKKSLGQCRHRVQHKCAANAATIPELTGNSLN
jgi:hypothetical protein